MRRMISFNNVSDTLTDEEADNLRRWYVHYHMAYTCYKWKYKKLKRIRLFLNMTSMTLVVVGGIVGGVTANPIVLGCISGPGILIQGYVAKSDISKKVETCRFAYKSYEKTLIELRSYIRGLPYDEATFLTDVKVLDDIIVDLCPGINGMSKKYDEIFGSELSKRMATCLANRQPTDIVKSVSQSSLPDIAKVISQISTTSLADDT